MRKRNKPLFLVMLILCISLGCAILPLPVFASGGFEGSGSMNSPWIISAAAGSDDVKAWLKEDTDGYTLCIEGRGRMTDSFRNTEVPWKDVKQNIHTVEIGEGVTNVGAYAFNFCKNLTYALLPESMEEIGTYAFHSTRIKHLVIPEGVNTIGRMIANPSTYYEVLGNPGSVDNHAFSTSLVSASDSAAAEALNAKTHVLALIVLNGGIYAETEEDLNNLSYGLIAPKKEGFTFGGWYQSADFTGQRCKEDERGRTPVNINHIYYAKWEETAITPTPTPQVTPDPVVPTLSPVPTSVIPNPETTPPIAPTSPVPEATKIPQPTDPAETSPDPGIPFIKGEANKNGWDIIKKEIEEMSEGNTLTVDMNDITILQSTVIDTMRGKDITVIFDMGNFIWSIDGMSITKDAANDVDLKVEIDTDHIPDHIVEEVVQKGDSTQLSLSYNGEFGFAAVLSINMGKNNRGRDAVLYYYNAESKKMEFQGEDRVDSQGWISFLFTHASDYVLVLSKASSEKPTIPVTPSPQITPKPEITPNVTPFPTKEPTPQLSETPVPTKTPTKTPGSSAAPTKVPEGSKDLTSTPTPAPAKVQGSEPTPDPVSSSEPTPEPTITLEPAPTSDITPTAAPTREPSTTQEPSVITKTPETPTLTEVPTPTLSAEVSNTSETKKKGSHSMAVIGIAAAGAAVFAVIVLVRRKFGGKK